MLYAPARAASRELSDAVQAIRQLGGQMVGQITVGAVSLAVLLLIPETLRTLPTGDSMSRR